MAEIATTLTQAEPEHPKAQRRWQQFPSWHRLSLGGVVLIAVFMDFFQLGKNGFGSYYPSAVRSMMDSWQNFFFASYDPGGFVTIDKPPLGFWLQVVSAKIFGFNPISILLPQALAGVLSVLLLYYLVRRHFGVVAGLLAALVLALTPISVVTNRNDTIDSTLALTLLIGAWAVLQASETGRLRWLLLSAIMVGLGFNIKMLEAYLVVPAYAVLYLLAAPRSIWKRVGHLALAGLLLLVVSFAWVVAVDLTPALQRPFVDSTQDNSELSLALGYNGLERLLGGSNNTAADGSNNTTADGTGATVGSIITGPTITGDNETQQSPPTSSRAVIHVSVPVASPLRLFQEALGGQIGWLLPLALLGMLALAWQRRPNVREDRKLQSLVFWGMWLLTMGIFFSVAGFFHEYYMTEMAPAIAALCGIGLVTMWKNYRRGNWRGWLLPVALIATGAEQIYLLSAYPAWDRWPAWIHGMILLIGVLSLVAVGTLVGIRIVPRLRARVLNVRLLISALSVGVLALLVAPTVWTITPILLSTQADTLLAGPPLEGPLPTGGTGMANVDPALIHYLEANQGKAKFLVAVQSSNSQSEADEIILATNKPVMAMNGFSHASTLTTSQLATLVKQGTVRFFLLPTPPPPPGNQVPSGGSEQNPLTTWVIQHCQTVPTSLWQSSVTDSSDAPRTGTQLYDCAAVH
ncbi:dolichyl-phosphate-mannose--protein mannosyltransferase [Ktedonobacteria bacterium brp13]|nr:dolichyl-phosphate-mannose--protein mannosyltransferase [Ktedonobacteria bacterium brp13]